MKLAIIRIKGESHLVDAVYSTLLMLKLKKINACIIKESTPSLMGMIKKIPHLLTWGEVSPEMEKKLKAKEKDGIISLAPPRKGYGRKGIKMPFSQKGAYGDRKEKINLLLERML